MNIAKQHKDREHPQEWQGAETGHEFCQHTRGQQGWIVPVEVDHFLEVLRRLDAVSIVNAIFFIAPLGMPAAVNAEFVVITQELEAALSCQHDRCACLYAGIETPRRHDDHHRHNHYEESP